jgi:hypothetical protein
MADDNGGRIRVILRTIQVNDNLEPPWDDEGEFQFTIRVASRDRGIIAETRLPSGDGAYSVSDHPARNRLYLNHVIFEGEVRDHLEVEIIGDEIDTLSANDRLGRYHRVWTGLPASWVGFYHPGDEGSTDPERMEKWNVTLEIEPA